MGHSHTLVTREQFGEIEQVLIEGQGGHGTSAHIRGSDPLAIPFMETLSFKNAQLIPGAIIETEKTGREEASQLEGVHAPQVLTVTITLTQEDTRRALTALLEPHVQIPPSRHELTSITIIDNSTSSNALRFGYEEDSPDPTRFVLVAENFDDTGIRTPQFMGAAKAMERFVLGNIILPERTEWDRHDITDERAVSVTLDDPQMLKRLGAIKKEGKSGDKREDYFDGEITAIRINHTVVDIQRGGEDWFSISNEGFLERTGFLPPHPFLSAGDRKIELARIEHMDKVRSLPLENHTPVPTKRMPGYQFTEFSYVPEKREVHCTLMEGELILDMVYIDKMGWRPAAVNMPHNVRTKAEIEPEADRMTDTIMSAINWLNHNYPDGKYW